MLEGPIVETIAPTYFAPVEEVSRARLSVRGKPSMRQVAQHVADRYGLTMRELESDCRERRVSHPRQLAMYLCRKLTGCSYPRIGRQFGDRDHTTVLFADRKIKRLRTQNPKLAARLDEMDDAIMTPFRRPDATQEGLARLAMAHLVLIKEMGEIDVH